MTAITDILRGELERLFDLEQMKKLSADLLGVPPDAVGGVDGKGAFARALVDWCAREDALEALTDALLLSAKGVDDRVRQVFEGVSGEELKPGTVLAGMRVIKKIGEGGVGVVYLAERKEEGEQNPQRFALKVVRAEYARDRAAVKRYLTVSRVLRTVKHANIAGVVAVGQLDDGRPWVATHYVDGQTLAARLSRTGPMHFNEARPVVRAVLTALETLHARGLVHGDVKTENIFMVRPQGGGEGKEPSGVLVDGGTDRLLARGAVHVDRTGVVPLFGTAKAIAPEQARGKFLEPKSDVYAFGAMLFEVLTGKPPFTGDNPIDVVVKHLGETPEAPSKTAPRGWVSKELDQLVLKALAKDAAERYQNAVELREALDAMVRATSVPPPRPTGTLDRSAFDKALQALKDKPADEELAVKLEKICEPAGEWELASKSLGEVAEKATDKAAKIALYFRVARLEEAERKSYEGAEAAYRKILELDAENEIAKIGIEEIRRASGNSEGLVELLLEKVEQTDTADGRAAIFREIAQLYEEKLSSTDNAFVAWVQALAEDPRDERSVREIERLADGPEKWNEALSTLAEAVKAGGLEPVVATNLYVLMGRWYSEKLQAPQYAIPCYQQAIALDPANDAALEGTVELYKKAQSWPDVAAILLRRADAASNPAKARDFRAAAADIMLTRLNDPARATDLFKQIVADDPAHPKATEGLEHILTEKGQFKELVELLENKSKNERGADKVATLTALAEVYEDRLGDHDHAATNFEAALAHEAKNVVALKGLERLYAKLGKTNELLANLKTQVEVAATPRQRIGLFERIGAILEEEFVDYAKAAEAYEEVVKVEPGHEAANTALARVYRQLHRFDDVAATLERHAKGTQDSKRKLELLLAGVKVLMADVGAPDRAVSMCERALAIDAGNAEALELMARLKASSGDTRSALDAVERLADTEKDPAKKADLLVRAGKILHDHGDNDRAIQKYKAALDLDPKSTSAVAALRSLYESRGDAHGAAELLQRELAITEGANAKARLLADLGAIYRDREHEPKKAKEFFSQALALDATCTPAATGLGQLYFEEKAWAEAAKYLEPVLARTSGLPKDVARDVSVMAGDAFKHIGQFEKAQRAYLGAKALAPEDREVLERVADVTFESGAADEAAELYRDLVERFRTKLVGGDKGRVLYRLGEAQRRAGDLPAALLALNEAVDLIPEDAGPFDSLRKVYEAQNKFDKAADVIRRRLDHAEDDERFDLYVALGDIALEKQKDKQKAAKAYVSALEIKADDRNLLSKLMAVYSETKDWGRLVEVVLRIAELVTDPKQLSKYYVTAAAISHQELQRVDEAVSYYEQALDNDPGLARAFEGLVQALTQKQQWQRLEEVYRAQLKRVEGTASAEQKAHLWDSLAELLQHRLNRGGEAIEAYEEAQKFDPENRRRGEILSEIYAKDPKRYASKAIATQNALLKKSPYRVESYQALRKLYADQKRNDEAWCVCQALKCLNMAEPDDEAFYKKHRAKKVLAPKDRLSDDLFGRAIVHEDQDALVTAIFAVIEPAVVATRSQPLEKFGLNAGKKRNLQGDNAVISKLLLHTAQLTGIAVPDVYTNDTDPGALSFVYASPAAIALGKAALANGPEQALAFVAARHLSYMRPGHYLRHLVPTGSGLRAWLLAAIKSATPQFPIPGDLEGSVQEHLAAFRQHLTGPKQEQLRSLVGKLLAAAPELDMKKWVAAVDLTADRVGFLVANDLEIATALVRASPEDAAAPSQKDRLKELYLYSVSEEYLGLRHKLGATVE